ncbi:MAG: excinuclease ABC subunit UvrA [Candidatus Kapaibacterium sp.]|jgi:excinuclease ABC subunit A
MIPSKVSSREPYIRGHDEIKRSIMAPAKKANTQPKSSTVKTKKPLQSSAPSYTDDGGERTHIHVAGAREHNLKNIDLTIPRDRLVVVTGISGSGKSSLAFDTLYAEGQRRYVECLSPYARQFLGMMKKPDIDVVEGISPAISIEQKSVGYSPRSTVGTVTEIYDYIRLLYAKIGTQYCVQCDLPVQSQSQDQIVDTILSLPAGRRVMILAPLVRGRKGHYREVFETARKQGFTKIRVDGVVQDIEPGMQVDRYKIHNIEVVVDRITASQEERSRISQSVELALSIGEDSVMILHETRAAAGNASDGEHSSEGNDNWDSILCSTEYSCPRCGTSYERLAPNMFSFNSPFGSCTYCDGLGELRDFDMARIIPDRELSLKEGGFAILGKERDTWLWQQVKSAAKVLGIALDVPIKDMAQKDIDKLLYGVKDLTVDIEVVQSAQRTLTYTQEFNGIVPNFKQQYENSTSTKIRSWLEGFMGEITCPECAGGRLKQSSLHVRIAGANIKDVTALDCPDALEHFASLSTKLSDRENRIAFLILKEITSRLHFLNNVGLSYLNLHRPARTLSGGETQRIRLASQIGSQLVGVMYVLDEPSIGLHQHDNSKLIRSLKELRDLGNTIIVVEHDREMIEEADVLVDIGPGAGVHGGSVLFTVPPAELPTLDAGTVEQSRTAQFLTGKREIEIPAERRPGSGSFITLRGATGNNLKNVDLRIPLGSFVCITGMSGSGKSSLVNHTLYPILNRHFYSGETLPLPYAGIDGLEHIDKVIEIDQSPIGRTPRSNPATYTGLFTLIRDHFTMMKEAKTRGYKAGRFSFNVKGGRCEECEGAGIKKIEMNFLPDVYVQCDVCGGKRYNDETLLVTYKGKSIADVLDMTVEEALEFFAEIPKIKSKLKSLYDVGLTYVTLGQQAPTLSGGEAQRVKLATELSKVSTGRTLYLLDEPTTGLHFEDIRILLQLLQRLASKGNSVVVIEHNLDVVKCADWIVDLGPEGGKNGGSIVAEGTPEQVAEIESSITGRYLQAELQRTRRVMEAMETALAPSR